MYYRTHFGCVRCYHQRELCSSLLTEKERLIDRLEDQLMSQLASEEADPGSTGIGRGGKEFLKDELAHLRLKRAKKNDVSPRE